MTPEEYCQQKAAASGSSFYYSFLFLPPPRRRAITALYAFCREVDDVVDEVHDEGVAQTKLAWWRQEVGRVFAGSPQHPVAQALVPVVREFALPEEHFQTIIDGMAMDLVQTRYLDFAALELYCHRVAGVVGLLSAEIFGYENPATRGYARDLGIAFQLTNICRDVGEDAHRGRVYLPQEDLARFGVARADLEQRVVTPQIRAALEFQIARVRRLEEESRAGIAMLHPSSQPCIEAARVLYCGIVDEVERIDYEVFDRRATVPLRRRLAVAGPAWIRARRARGRRRAAA